MPAVPSPTPAHEPLSFAEFKRALAHQFLRLGIHSTHPQSFRGSVTSTSSADIQLLNIAASPHMVNRTQHHINASRGDFLKFTVVGAGEGRVTQGSRTASFGPGDMVVYETNRPYLLEFSSSTELTVVMFPRHQLSLSTAELENLAAEILPAREGAAAILHGFIRILGEGLSAGTAAVPHRYFQAAAELASAFLAEQAALAQPRPRTRLLQRVHAYVESHHHDHDLTPERIAADNFISVRNLYNLMAEQGTTISALLRLTRLEHSHADLLNPTLAERTVTAIALDHGFVNTAHFSRVFKAHYGRSPSEVRPQAANRVLAGARVQAAAKQ